MTPLALGLLLAFWFSLLVALVGLGLIWLFFGGKG